MHLTKLKHHLLAVATAVAATACTSTEQKPAFSGTVETDGINEMFFNYAPDNDLMAIRTINIEPDSLGRFTFPDSLIMATTSTQKSLPTMDISDFILRKGKAWMPKSSATERAT